MKKTRARQIRTKFKDSKDLGKSRMDGRTWTAVTGYFAILTCISGLAFFMLDVPNLPIEENPTILEVTIDKEDSCNV